jgi:GNAT superfamily N-acetyltransferase
MRRFSSLGSILLFTLQTIITNIFLLLKSARAFTAVARSTKRYSCPKRLYLTQTMPFSERIQWKVRPATLADKNAVNELLMNSYENLLAADYDQEFLETALPLISKGREELLTCGTWYVVEDPRDGTLTGCGGWTFRNPAQERAADGRKVPHLRHFATRADMTRKGIGKAIWNQSWDDIIEQSTDGVDTTLEVFSTITAAPFYASVGFEKVKELSLPLADNCNFPCILMRRDPQKS